MPQSITPAILNAVDQVEHDLEQLDVSTRTLVQLLRAGQSGGGGTPAFAPDDISGLELWLDASDASTITSSAGSVSAWNDKSGNTRHATQSTPGSQPTTGVTTQNSKNVIDFSTDYLVVGSAPQLYSNTTGMSVFMVATEPNAYASMLSKYDATNNRREYAMGLNTTAPVFFVTDDPTSAATRSLAEPSNWSGFAIARATWAPGGPAKMAINAGTEAVGGSNVTDMTAGVAPLEIGRYNLSLLPSSLSVAEVLVYSSVLSGTDLSNVESYLASKWGITL